ncbi:MAG TPA: orotidine-5'-phosphate decarboxylase [Candidatus Udaeobacter sp.]|nr:orotidine-5'-phosphate decarboxylase [Candidatus Udaeobacter sp.]
MAMMTRQEAAQRIYVALDVPKIELAAEAVDELGNRVGGYKIGLELGTSKGWSTVHNALTAQVQVSVFGDIKIKDIPKTAGRTAAALIRGNPGFTFFNVHADGGEAMIQAAREQSEAVAVSEGRQRPKLLAVTVLTSLDESDLSKQGIAGSTADQVIRLGKLAISAGADGLVCSAREVMLLRQAIGPEPILMVPGLRLPGSSTRDQKRVMEPGELVRIDPKALLVIGSDIMDKSPGQRLAALERVIDNIIFGIQPE